MIADGEFRERVARLRSDLPPDGAAWVTRRQHVGYLTGCSPPADYPAMVAVSPGRVDALWSGEIPAAAPDWIASASFDPWAAGAARAAARGLVREHGLDRGPLLVDGGAVPYALRGLDVLDGSQLFAELVREKSLAEVAAIAANLAGNDAAFARVARELGPGASDYDVLGWTMDEICRHAEEAVAYEGNIGLGPAGADFEAQPRGSTAARGDTLFVDLYPMRSGYGGDSTRSFAVGTAPTWAADAHARLLRALEAAEAELRPGAAAGEVDRVCRDAAERGGAERIPHHVGHGLGIFGQEPPYLVPGNRDRLRPGDVVAVEPGLYEAERGGLRLEDVFLVTANGSRRLSQAPRALLECG